MLMFLNTKIKEDHNMKSTSKHSHLPKTGYKKHVSISFDEPSLSSRQEYVPFQKTTSIIKHPLKKVIGAKS